MAGRPQSPYRLPCGLSEWPASPTLYRGCGGKHIRTTEKETDLYAYVGKVNDYHRDPSGDPVDPLGIDPYPKPDGSALPGGDCPDPPTCPAEPPAANNGLPRCGSWLTSEFPSSAGADQVLIGYNLYFKDGTKVDLSECHKIGFKNIQAWKAWHGQPGYLNADGIQYDFTCFGCDFVNYEPEHATGAAQTRYLVLHASASRRTYNEPGHVAIAGGDVEQTMSVDRYSGVKTESDCSETPVVVDGDLTTTYETLERSSSNGIALIVERYAFWKGSFDSYTADLECDSDTAWTLTLTSDDATVTIVVDLVAGTMYLTATGTQAGLFETIECDDDGTTSTLAWSGSSQTFLAEAVETFSLSAELSSPYTAADVESDVYGLLAQWNMADDALYRWRRDEFTNVAPLLSYDEAVDGLGVPTPVMPTMDTAPGCAYVDPSTATGAILGKPNPAGCDKTFDKDHRTWFVCNGDYDYVGARGAFSGQTNFGDGSDVVVPPTATQWTENRRVDPDDWAYAFPRHGAWQRWKVNRGVCYAQKWAEILNPRPSLNTARPCGIDRFVMDEATVRCLTSDEFDGTNLELVDDGGGRPDFVVADVICVDDASALAGIYPIASGSGTSYVLGTRIQTLPEDDDRSSLFPYFGKRAGKVRYPTCKGIGGRVKVISAVQDGAQVHIQIEGVRTDDGEAYPRTADSLDFASVGSLGTSVAIDSVEGNDAFTVTGTLGGVYSGGGYVSSHGAAAYKFYDDQSKGDYGVVFYKQDLRKWRERDRVIAQYVGRSEGCEIDDPGAAIRPDAGDLRDIEDYACVQACLAGAPCSPRVVCFSPNYTGDEDSIDSFPAGQTILFGLLPGDALDGAARTVPADDRFGAQWQAAVLQDMIDPLWQTPYKSCDAYAALLDFGGFHWKRDEVACVFGDGVADPDDGLPDYFYPYPRLVEFRCSLPTVDGDAAPALPAGASAIGCPTIEDCPPPDYAGNSIGTGIITLLQPETAWGVWLREQQCVCRNNRPEMTLAYTEDGVTCR